MVDGFEALLARYPLAFADHGAEFYSGSGNDPVRAFELAQLNFGNRPTLKASEQAYATALAAGKFDVAAQLYAFIGECASKLDAARKSDGARNFMIHSDATGETDART